MQETKRLSINEAPKWFKAILLCLPLFGFFLISTQIYNDFYFLYPTGEYIVNHGFPTTDILSMHSTMDIIVQQWLTTVLYYYVYNALGAAGIIGIVYLCYLALCVMMYKLCKLVSDNFFVSAVCAFCADILIALMFMMTRPQTFTYLIVLAELYALEKFVQTKSIKHLFVLPVLSLLLVNLHASMWLLFFVLALPYAAAALPIHIGKIRQAPCCSFVKLLVTGVVCFAVGFLNPYGAKAVTYVFTSYGDKYINSLISEMSSLSLDDPSGYLFFAVLAVFAVLAIGVKKRRFTTRFVLLFGGTLLMGMMTFKSLAYYYLAAFVSVAYLLRDTDAAVTVTPPKKSNNKRVALLSVLLVVALIGAVGVSVSQRQNEENFTVVEKNTYEELDDIISIMEQENKEVVLFTGFDWGPYMEFKGYHPYFDSRAELYLKANNHEFDYLKEYCNFCDAVTYYEDFTDKYGFNYLIVSKTNEVYPNTSLLNDPDYELLYEGKTVNLFAAKDR